jgi:hypothetical protein
MAYYETSVVIAESAILDGTIHIVNDEGLKPGDRIVIVKKGGGNGKLVLKPTTKIKTKFRLDPPVRLVNEGYQIVAVV